MRHHQKLIRAALTAVIAIMLVVRNSGAEDLIYNRLGEYLEHLRQQFGVPGLQAAVIGRNGILWERAFGYQDVEHSVAMRTDTPMHFDGLTESFTASLVLRCVEEGRLSLNDRIGQFKASSPDATATILQVLTHNIGTPESPTFAYQPERLENLSTAVRTCTADSYRETLANLLDQQAMIDAVPGPDVVTLAPPAEGILTAAVDRYRRILQRLALPYSVDAQRRASVTQYAATTLTPTAGLIGSVRDFAQFDTALRTGVIVRTDTLSAAWRAPAAYPHGIGWFVQSYNGENVVWQFGAGGGSANGSSSMSITIPSKGVTLILVANSGGLAKGFSLNTGDLTLSPFARVFLGLYLP